MSSCGAALDQSLVENMPPTCYDRGLAKKISNAFQFYFVLLPTMRAFERKTVFEFGNRFEEHHYFFELIWKKILYKIRYLFCI
jgi:hypothetical protein